MSTRCTKCDFPFPDHETRDGLCLNCLAKEHAELKYKLELAKEAISKLVKITDPTWGEEPNE